MTKTIKCIIVDDEPVAREILEDYIAKTSGLKLSASCKNAVEAFKQINTSDVNLVFLDINMPEISGLSFAKSINKSIKVVFTTAYREYAVEGFDLRAVDYLLKPISYERFLQSVNKYIDENTNSPAINNPAIAEKEENRYFFVRADRKMVKINIPDVLYVESLGDYLKIITRNKTVTCRETITNIEAKLSKEDFIRTHRSYIVAKNKIESFTNEYVEIKDKMLPISRTYKEVTLKKLQI